MSEVYSVYEKKKEAWDFRSNIQLKNYGQNSLMSHAGMYKGIISVRSTWKA